MKHSFLRRLRGALPRRWTGWLKFFAIIGGGGAIAAGLVLLIILQTLPSIDEVQNRQVRQSTKIYDRTGEVLLYEISGGEKRTVVPLGEMPDHLKWAVIATEDENFYTEPGFDWRAILRATLVNLRLYEGRLGQGGSSITQQLARNAFLSTERSYIRKLRELVLAIQLDRHYTKDQILELYLNEIPLGGAVYGAQSASRTYFGKNARDLTLAESATLAALIQAPSYYSPWGSHTKELFARQEFVLQRMAALGKTSSSDLAAAKKERVVFQPQGRGLKAPHFVVGVQDYLVKKYGEDLVRTGGLSVQTTLDWKLQEIAERVVREGAERNERLYGGTNAALVAEDARTGEVLALVGSRDYFDTEREGNFNVATQGLRQPGSALKPFVYLAAFLKGYLPETALFDVPTEFVPQNDACPVVPNYTEENTSCFHPQNFDHVFRGPVSMRTALAQSMNIPAVKALYLVGLENTLSLLQSFGITTLNDPRRYGLSLVLGGGEIHLSELVNAYAVLAQDGVRREQATVLSVKDASGRVLERHEVSGEPVADPERVRMINSILSDADARSGLFGSSLQLTVFPDHDVALKTGTSNDYRDAWTFGYTPSLVVGVWAGNNNNTAMHRQGSSILAAVPIWHDFMAEALKEQPTETFGRPAAEVAGKPILDGEYVVGGQVHNILYYVDKDDPRGNPPADPSRDPQFNNWELPVLLWAATNMPGGGFGNSTIIDPGAPRIIISTPTQGAFINQDIAVAAQVISATPIARATVFLNSVAVREFADLGTVGRIDFSFQPGALAPQNNLEIEAVSADGKTTRAAVIVYH